VSSAGADGNEEIGFGRFRLDLERRKLFRDARPVSVGGRPLDILCLLASASGGVVGKDEILKRLWPGRVVEEGNLHVHVSALRRALGENGHSYVVTVPGRGYRLSGLNGSELAGAADVGSHKVAPSDKPATRLDTTPAEQHSAASYSGDAQALERRQLTLMSCELVDAPRLATLLDPEDLSIALNSAYRCCSDVIVSFGGSVVRIAGAIMLACFGYPRAGEHDAEQAIRAGLALVEGVRELDAEARQVRLGIATGPVVIGNLVEKGSEGGIIGEAVTLAAALRRTAEPGTIVISESSSRLVGDLFDVERREGLAFDGFDEPVASYRVLRRGIVDSRFQALRGSNLTPIVGRCEEVDLLLRRWQQAKAGELRVALVTGEPGIGKSRLCDEFQERIRQEPYICLRYFCSPHHQDRVLYPIIRQLEAVAGFSPGESHDAKLVRLRSLLTRATLASEADMSLLADMLTLAGPHAEASAEFSARRLRDLTFEALMRQLDALATRCPVLISLDDAHWSDPTTLELLSLVLGRFARRPILVLITFRPEFTAPWIGQSYATTLTLGRLDRHESAALARRVVGEHTLPGDVIDTIVERTDGVPLFIEELTKAVLEGAAPQGRATVPATLQASLMARLDRLPHAKQAAQVGAVIGRSFSYALLAEAGGLGEAPLAKGLDELLAAGLVTASGNPPDATYTFKHALVQDVAYESLLRSRRAEIHAAVVTAAEKNGHSDTEPGVLAHHSAQAGLVAKAACYYRLAAESSIERAAVVETQRQLQRGLAFAASLPEGMERDALEAELLLALATVLQTTTGMSNDEAGQLFRRASEASRRSGRPQLVSRALWGQFTNVLVRGEVVAARGHAEQLLAVAEACDDVHTQLAARVAMGIAAYYQGHFDVAREHLAIQQTLLEAQSEATELDWRTSTAGPAFLALTLACLGYLEQAATQLDRAIDLAGRKGAFALAYSLSVAVRVLVILRDDKGLREHATRLVALSEAGGFHQFLNQGLCALGWLEARTTASGQGLDRLRDGLARMVDLATFVCLPFYRCLLGDVLATDEGRSEALASLDSALELSARTGDTWFSAELHRMRGEVLADPALMETELQQALGFACVQSAKLFELRAATSLARLWMKQGRRKEACQLLAPVHGWFTEGFGTPDLENARQALDELAAPI
jgi:class 3 adenylate cyclase/predicted ATPase